VSIKWCQTGRCMHRETVCTVFHSSCHEARWKSSSMRRLKSSWRVAGGSNRGQKHGTVFWYST